MSPVITRQAALVGALAGLGLWATGGSLDHAPGADGAFRVAMLPSLWRLVAAVTLCSLAAVLLVWALRLPWRGRGEPSASRAALDTLRPFAAGALLVLPYLPWLPDRLPALLLLAGPGALIWWGVLAGQAGVTWLSHRHDPEQAPAPLAADATAGGTARRRRWTSAIFLCSVLASGVVAERFIRTPLFPGGDEPHYLVIAQSLWRDGDLRIENNHQRRDYDEYFHRDLAPHYLTRGVDREIYSIHPIGMPVAMAPVYAAAGYDGTVTVFVLLGAMALTLAWRLAWAITGSAAAATFGWATLAFGVPWLFNTFSVYPEIPAAAAVMVAFTLTSGRLAGRADIDPRQLHALRFVAAGIALGALPWLSTKYAVMAAALGLVVLARLWLPWPSDGDERRRAVLRTLLVGLPCVVALAGWFLFFKLIWGTYSPAAPYGSQRETRLEYLPQGAPGLLFDQEYGIVLFAPALLMVLPGLWTMVRAQRATRRVAVELCATWAGLLGVVGAFHIWWGGSAIVGRPVIAALPLLVIPVACQWRATTAVTRRAAQYMLLWVGIALTVVVATAQNGLLLVAGRDGSSQVLEYLAPSSAVWTVLPTYLRQSPAAAAGLTLLWVAPLLALGAVLARVWRGPDARTHSFGRAATATAMVTVAAVAVLSAVAGAIFAPSTPAPPLDRRPRVRLLDEYDAGRRPIAVRYTPAALVAPETVPPLFPFRVNERGSRTLDRNTQLLGQRLSLPAGRYGLDVVVADAGAAPVSGAVAVQVGRSGPAYLSWELALQAPASWGRAFTLPVDAGFVGVKASPEVVAAGPQIRITPQSIVPASARPSTRGVLGTSRYGEVQVFVHGEDAWLEGDGFWVRGGTTADLTLLRPPRRPLVLDVRAGPRKVDVTLRIGDEVRRATLDPGMSSAISFPAGDGATSSLQVTTSEGFVPAELEPGSRDRRLLGCWITIR